MQTERSRLIAWNITFPGWGLCNDIEIEGKCWCVIFYIYFGRCLFVLVVFCFGLYFVFCCCFSFSFISLFCCVVFFIVFLFVFLLVCSFVCVVHRVFILLGLTCFIVLFCLGFFLLRCFLFLFCFFVCFFFVWFIIFSRPVYHMFPVSLDCPCSIAPSVLLFNLHCWWIAKLKKNTENRLQNQAMYLYIYYAGINMLNVICKI